MNNVSNISSLENGQNVQGKSPRSALADKKEALMEEFSKLLGSISDELANQGSDVFLSMDLSAAPIRRKKQEKAEKEANTSAIPDRARQGCAEDAPVEMPKKERIKEKVKNPEKKELKEDSSDRVAEKSPKKTVEAEKNVAPEREMNDSPENVAVTRCQQEANELPEATLPSEETLEELNDEQLVIPATPPDSNQTTEEVSNENAVAQAVSQSIATDVSSSEPRILEAEVAKPELTEVDAKQPEQERGLNSDISNAEAAFIDEATNEGTEEEVGVQINPQKVKPTTLQADLPQSGSEIEEVQKVLKKFMVEKLANDESNGKALELKPILTQALQSLDTRVKVAAPSHAPQILMSSLKEVGAIMGSNSGSNVNNSTLNAFANAQKSNETQTTKRPETIARAAQSRTIERIEDALREVARSKDGKSISIRLDPPSLGSVKIDVTYKEGTLSAKLVADSQQVNQLIRDKAFDLQAVLRKLGLPVERVIVQVGQEQQAQQQTFSNQSFSSESRSANDGKQSSQEKLMNLFPDLQEAATSIEKQLTLDDHWVA